MLTLIQCLFHPSNTVVACKRPWSFCQKCRWQVTPKHTYTLDSSGNTQLQSSQLAEPLWTDPGRKSGISLSELISTLKKKHRQGMNCRTFSQNPRTRGRSQHSSTCVVWKAYTEDSGSLRRFDEKGLFTTLIQPQTVSLRYHG